MKTLKIPQATKKGYVEVGIGGCFDWTYPGSATRRGRVQGGGDICPTLTAGEPEIWVFEGYEEDIETIIKDRKDGSACKSPVIDL